MKNKIQFDSEPPKREKEDQQKKIDKATGERRTCGEGAICVDVNFELCQNVHWIWIRISSVSFAQ